MRKGATIHAGCVVVGEAGILIRGEAGAGKSTLARDLVHAARQAGLFASLVSDDRTRLSATHGRLVAQPVEAIAGRIEVRGLGIVAMPHEAGAVIRLVVDLAAEEPLRMPEPDDLTVSILGVTVSRLRHRRGAPLASLVLSRLDSVHDKLMTV